MSLVLNIFAKSAIILGPLGLIALHLQTEVHLVYEANNNNSLNVIFILKIIIKIP